MVPLPPIFHRSNVSKGNEFSTANAPWPGRDSGSLSVHHKSPFARYSTIYTCSSTHQCRTCFGLQHARNADAVTIVLGEHVTPARSTSNFDLISKYEIHILREHRLSHVLSACSLSLLPSTFFSLWYQQREQHHVRSARASCLILFARFFSSTSAVISGS